MGLKWVRVWHWHVLILQRCIPGSAYFVDPGTIFMSENVILTISPLNITTSYISLKSEGNG